MGKVELRPGMLAPLGHQVKGQVGDAGAEVHVRQREGLLLEELDDVAELGRCGAEELPPGRQGGGLGVAR